MVFCPNASEGTKENSVIIPKEGDGVVVQTMCFPCTAQTSHPPERRYGKDGQSILERVEGGSKLTKVILNGGAILAVRMKADLKDRVK